MAVPPEASGALSARREVGRVGPVSLPRRFRSRRAPPPASGIAAVGSEARRFAGDARHRARPAPYPFVSDVGHSRASNRSRESSSGVPNGTGRCSVANTAAGAEIPSRRAWGIAMPLPTAVGPSRSRRRKAANTAPWLLPTLSASRAAMPLRAERFRSACIPSRTYCSPTSPLNNVVSAFAGRRRKKLCSSAVTLESKS